ncbi:uncharacterized protein perm1b [Synchiropus picturatus]
MDDIDHSMMLAEEDWRSFDEECEECCLVQPALACPEGANPHRESGTSTVLKDKSVSSTEEDSMAAGHPGVRRSQGEAGDLSKVIGGAAKLETEDKQIQTEEPPDPKPTEEKDLEPLKRTSITFRQERERWFVTVNDSPSQRCRQVAKRKRRLKKVAKNKRAGRGGVEAEAETEKDRASTLGSFDPPTEDVMTEENHGVMTDSTGSEEFEDAVQFLSELRGQGILSATRCQEVTLEREAEEVSSTDDDGEEKTGGNTNHRPPEAPPPDSPEAFARAAGHVRPVYAISAFWDEMEKLTINDILQLRRAGGPPLGGGEDSRAAGSKVSPSQMETFDNADSDYCTQAEEAKPDRWSWDFSTSDCEEECNASPSPRRETPTSEDLGSTCSEGRETPVPAEGPAGNTLGHEAVSRQRRMRTSQSLRDMKKELGVDDLSLITTSAGEEREVHGGQRGPAPLLTNKFDPPEALQAGGLFSANDVTLDPEFPNIYPGHESKLVPKFSSSHPTVRELASSSLDQLLHTFMKENFPPARLELDSLVQTAERERLVPSGPGAWMRSLSLQRISFCSWSKLPVHGEEDQVVARLVVDPEQILETMKGTGQGGRSTPRQSDMCLLCIAFASWVLTSSEADNTDAWKAALLAHVSALSAIQYLRHYMRRRRSRPPHRP